MFCIIKQKSEKNGKIVAKPVRGVLSLPGENRGAFAARVEREELKEGETRSDVFSRFTGIDNKLAAGMWKTALEEDLTTEEACSVFKVDSRYVGAWASAVKAGSTKIPERLPEATEEEEEEIDA
jgi:hypothetical protein